MDITIKAEWDKSSEGEARNHFVFPELPKKGYEKAMQRGITGGLYITKDIEIPDTITIVLRKD